MKNILEKYALWTSVIIALGMIISNTHLSSYGIVDFKVFQVKNISTGLMFVITSLLHVLIFNFKFDLGDVEKIGDSKILHSVATRFSSIIFIYIFSFYGINNLDFLSRLITIVATPFIILFYEMENIYTGATMAEKKRKINRLLINFTSFGFKWIVPTSLIALTIIDSNIKKLVFEYSYIPILVVLFSFIRKQHFFDEIEKTEQDDKQPYYSSLFQLKSNGKPSWKEISYIVIWAIAMTFLFIRMYISLYYQKIPENFGGSKPTNIELELDNGEKVIGKKIHQNEIQTYILQGDTIRHIENLKIKLTIK